MNIFCDLCNLLHHRKWLITLIDSYKNQSCLILTLTTNSRNTLTQLHVHVRLVPRKKHANVTKCIWVSNEWCCLYFCRLEKKKQTEYTPCTFSGSDFCCKFPLSAREHLRLSWTLKQQLEYMYMHVYAAGVRSCSVILIFQLPKKLIVV